MPLSESLAVTLKTFKQETVLDISGRVFPISDRSLRCAFKKALKKAEIEDFRIHDMRHTFATRLVQRGVGLYKVQRLLGHKGIQMTQRYTHHYPESLRSSVEVLDDLSQVRHNEGISGVSGTGNQDHLSTKIS